MAEPILPYAAPPAAGRRRTFWIGFAVGFVTAVVMLLVFAFFVGSVASGYR